MDNKPKDFMFVYNNINNVFDVVKRSTSRIPGAKIISEDINNYTVEMKIGGGLFSKGDNITITLDKVEDLQTKIYFDDHSKKGALATKNKNIEKLKLVIDTLLPKIKMDVESPNDTVKSNSPVTNNVVANNMVNSEPIVMPQDTGPLNNGVVINQEPAATETNEVESSQPTNNEVSQSKQKEDANYDPLKDFMNKI